MNILGLDIPDSVNSDQLGQLLNAIDKTNQGAPPPNYTFTGNNAEGTPTYVSKPDPRLFPPRSRLQQFMQQSPTEALAALGVINKNTAGLPDEIKRQVYQSLGFDVQPTGALPQKLQDQVTAELIKHQLDRANKEYELNNKPLGKDATKYYNDYGDQATQSMITKDAEDKGFIVRDPNFIRNVQGAKSVYAMLDDIQELVPRVLKSIEKYKGQTGMIDTLGNMIRGVTDVQLNQMALNAAIRAGDPIARRFQALMTPTSVRFGMALGVPGGRESLGMINKMLVDVPGTADSQESAIAVMDQARRTIEAATGVKPKPAAGHVGDTGAQKLATSADVHNAMVQAKGDRKAALQLLRQQGFTGAE